MKKIVYLTFLISALATNLVANEVEIKTPINEVNPTDINKKILNQKEDSKEELSVEYKKLLEAAVLAREKAYAPYSKFKVGAAVLTEDGKIFTGTNIENASYGLTICAERCAIFKAVSEGYKRFSAIAIVLDDKDCGRPCGACRQVINEFNSDIPVVMSNIKNKIEIESISKLLPKSFCL